MEKKKCKRSHYKIQDLKNINNNQKEEKISPGYFFSWRFSSTRHTWLFLDFFLFTKKLNKYSILSTLPSQKRKGLLSGHSAEIFTICACASIFSFFVKHSLLPFAKKYAGSINGHTHRHKGWVKKIVRTQKKFLEEKKKILKKREKAYLGNIEVCIYFYGSFNSQPP